MQAPTGQLSTHPMQPGLPQLTEFERGLRDRLLKLAPEIDRFEGYTQPHATEVARLAERLGAVAGLHGADVVAISFAALAHDLGERTMKRNYLLRPDGLTWEETLDLWRHPIIGEQQAAELKLPRQAQLLIRWHHEWWNGRGYPDGLTGVAIPLGARILRAADTYCALIADRPHRAAFDPLDAEQIIADGAGLEFDPSIAKLLLLLLADDRREIEARNYALPLPHSNNEIAPPLAPEVAATYVTSETPEPFAAPEDREVLLPATAEDSPAATVAEQAFLAEAALPGPAPDVEPGPAPDSGALPEDQPEASEGAPGAAHSFSDASQPPSLFETDTEEFERVPPTAELHAEPPARDEELEPMQRPEENPEQNKDAARFYQ